ncbi:DUF2237 domain-containing protein [Halomicroarcula sp. F13]|uniref:DUF2237 domain-containing protein n=1 Tax=Haloarcula rubra TaxID=2487747 RepID=A0AAW4PRV7_9EURY|nr:DUF2237 domain-containing protein [Halomicroarcula rubra]MBX0323446.1 DUF2237 domain-containing protein [Halomicroarcula rubra]
MESESNVLGGDLESCSQDPVTGFMRDGYCYPLQRDPGRHEICAVMTETFLEYSKAAGNDLVTPRPELNFPGLEPGDRWCVCVPRWIEAHEDGHAPPVVLSATSEDVLEDVSLETLRSYSHENETES